MMMKKLMMRTSLLIVMAGGVLSLSACAIGDSNDQTTAYVANKAERMYQNDRVQEPKSLISKTKQVFLSNAAIERIEQVKLPPVFSKPLVYTTANNESFSRMIANIAKLTGQPIKVASSEGGATGSQSGLVSYQGSLSNVLTQIANKHSMNWRYTEGVVEFFTLETKVFALDAPVGSFTLSNGVNSSSDSGSSSVGGTSSMKLSYSLKTDSPWEAAVKTITSMLSSSGKINANSVEGYVTVTDSPTALRKVSSYIKKINDRTNKKIAVRVDVYDVETTSSSDFGFDMDALINGLSNRLEISNTSSAMLSSDNSGEFTSFTFSGGSHTHSIILSALNSIGRTTEVTGSTIYTVSGQPAPIQSTEQQSYLESISTVTSDSDTTVSMTPGTVVSGYSMMVTPRIQSNSQILVNLNIQITSLVDIEDYTVSTDDDSETIQLPKTRSKNFLENMVLHNGQSILIAGFQDDYASSSTGSPTAMDMWQLGGAKSTERDKSTTVIVVTPYIIGD